MGSKVDEVKEVIKKTKNDLQQFDCLLQFYYTEQL